MRLLCSLTLCVALFPFSLNLHLFCILSPFVGRFVCYCASQEHKSILWLRYQEVLLFFAWCNRVKLESRTNCHWDWRKRERKLQEKNKVKEREKEDIVNPQMSGHTFADAMVPSFTSWWRVGSRTSSAYETRGQATWSSWWTHTIAQGFMSQSVSVRLC